ncbi:MAG: sugar ABC transporter permease [Clostridia bacterium]|nr:sugar ABC transporter permease [Clostridia bacterium]
MVGLKHYNTAFNTDPRFLPLLTAQLQDMVTTVPVIIVFSLFIAVLLNQEFRGRALARTVFFLPVVIGSGIVISIIQGDQMSNEVINGTRAAGLFESGSIFDMLEESGLDSDLIGTMMGIVNNIFELSWHSGLQIILFLAALQTVPDQLYEVAKVEGATSWEIFFKITLPMITPILLVNVIYTLVDTFTDYGNSLLVYILDLGKKLNFEYSAALGNIYFVIIFAIIGLVLLLIGRMVTYVEK